MDSKELKFGQSSNYCTSSQNGYSPTSTNSGKPRRRYRRHRPRGKNRPNHTPETNHVAPQTIVMVACGKPTRPCGNNELLRIISDRIIHKCQNIGCGKEIVGAQIDEHEQICETSKLQIWGIGHVCDEQMKFLDQSPNIQIFYTARRAPLIDYHGFYASTSNRVLVPALFYAYGTYFGLMIGLRNGQIYFFISQVKCPSFVENHFMFQLGIFSPNGDRIHEGVVHSMFDADMAIRLEDCLTMPQPEISEFVGVYSGKERLIIDVFIYCPKISKAPLKWESSALKAENVTEKLEIKCDSDSDIYCPPA